ncbi:hypothetical protein PHJA_002144200 [Phtheirospermum japonicum]|uniref:Uncharacterized protein n=1 Tax=Phtheirospermum japonicum TaxID=374723 RepID=A0A830D0X6_9LAMI|nr:hypothetical protein PHJA_002144200 [Phtheirospermum japonicum]
MVKTRSSNKKYKDMNVVPDTTSDDGEDIRIEHSAAKLNSRKKNIIVSKSRKLIQRKINFKVLSENKGKFKVVGSGLIQIQILNWDNVIGKRGFGDVNQEMRMENYLELESGNRRVTRREKIPEADFDINIHRKRLACLLYNHGIFKLDNGYASEEQSVGMLPEEFRKILS